MAETVPILFENNDILAVHKPEGLVSNARSGTNSLPARLGAAYSGRLYTVHRLDREVSGVLVLAKSAETHRFLNGQFSQGLVRKTYLAVTQGIVEQERGFIDKPIREFGSGRMGIDAAGGKPSRTEFEVKERLQGFTLLKVHPLSGRRHQVRVHLYSIGHPVVGDLKYGDRKMQKTFPRLMLHALDISFRLLTGEKVTVEAPVPQSFQTVLSHLRDSSG